MRRFGSVVAMVSALVVVSGCSSEGPQESRPSESKTAAESGPRLEGSYRSRSRQLRHGRRPQASQGAGPFEVVIRSCSGGACVAPLGSECQRAQRTSGRGARGCADSRLHRRPLDRRCDVDRQVQRPGAAIELGHARSGTTLCWCSNRTAPLVGEDTAGAHSRPAPARPASERPPDPQRAAPTERSQCPTPRRRNRSRAQARAGPSGALTSAPR